MVCRALIFLLSCLGVNVVERNQEVMEEAKDKLGDLPPVVSPGVIGPVNDMDLPDEMYQELHEHPDHFENHEYIDEEDDPDDWFDQWGDYMQDYVQDMVVSFNLKPRTDEIFHQDVGPEPTKVRGGYFTSGFSEGQSPIDFLITDPDGEAVLNKQKGESLFFFTTTKAGTYNFIFSNPKWMEAQVVTFSIGAGNSTTLNVDHVVGAQENARRLESLVKEIHTESQYLWTRHRGHVQKSQALKHRMLLMAIGQFVFVGVVVAAQVHYIKSLVSNRRIF